MEYKEQSHEEILDLLVKALEAEDLEGFREVFLSLHFYDQGQAFMALNQEERDQAYRYLSAKEVADMLDTMEEEHEEALEEYLEEMNDQYAADVLDSMYVDNAVDLMNQLEDPDLVSKYLHLMPVESGRKISQLMNYLDETAGSIMTTEYVAVQATWTLAQAYDYIRQQAKLAETIYYVYVVDSLNRLLGVISLRDLIVNAEDKLIEEIMSPRVITVHVNDDQEEVAQKVQDYDLLALPVVGFDRELQGIITVDDILDVMQEEAESDYSGLAAVDVSESHHHPLSAAKSRLPWLITLLFLGMGTSTLISQYGQLIEEVSVLSAFVTLITGTAGNAGTQSLAVAVRKLTNKDEGDHFFDSVGFELITGLITGLVVGLAVFGIVIVWQGNMILGFTIGIAMMSAIVVANLAGSLIPKLMDRLGFDPAVASGPFISTLSDLTSVFIYFSIAQFFLSALIG
ncbi:magnesium transporter [Hutsoniella sourekii]|uniref:magnesium transporter n=1 Tax=Hutsoniella sourekii TaxID=87650 RepID=UPI0004825B2E|nr:magnesium transporter [Hutsoniella sourekii]